MRLFHIANFHISATELLIQIKHVAGIRRHYDKCNFQKLWKLTENARTWQLLKCRNRLQGSMFMAQRVGLCGRRW